MLQQRTGLSLVEVLVALAVIGLAFGILAVTQVSNLRITSESRLASQATEVANRQLEDMVRCLLASHTAFQSGGTACVEASDVGDEGGEEDTADAGDTFPDEFSEGRFSGFVDVRPFGDAYEQEGVLVVEARITAPVQAVFARLVSCIDVQPAPAIADHVPCPEPVVP